MSDIARLTKQEVAESPRKGFWVHAGDLNQKIEQGQLREAAMQQRLTTADERVEVLQDLLTHAHIAINTMAPGFFLLEKIDAALKPAEGGGDAK